MLSLRYIFRELSDLKLLCVSKYRFKCNKFNIENLYRLAYNSGFIQSNFYSTENKVERFPLDEINNLNTNQIKCDIGQWYEIVDEILQAKAAGKNLPEYLKMDYINELLECGSRNKRFKFLTFLFKKEKMKLNEAEKRRKKKTKFTNLDTKDALDTDHIQYGLGRNTLFLRTWRRNTHKFYDKRLANSILFGQKIVIDLGYDEFMIRKEKRDCAAQLALVHSINKQNPEPYNLYFCNANSESRCIQYLNEEMPKLDESLITLTEQSYLDIFPKEDLVYLSPHASKSLTTYDNKAVYIIGGFVDTVKRDHVSLYKSQDEGIRSYSLPLDDYVLWGCGSRSLSINQVFSIMQTMRDTGDWRQAFKHVPIRKLRRVEADSEETQFMPDKLFVVHN